MTTCGVFTYTEPDLLPLLDELRRLEPIFHTTEFGTTPADFQRRMSPGYWEVGASGRRYSRDFILRNFQQTPPVDAPAAGWKTTDHALQRLGPQTYLLTCNLKQGPRFTRRATIWRNSPEGWLVVYHQGTIVSANGDDVAPPQS
jgi:hypothetical protein